ncbi:styrene monooxygenase/indole monooxygenase family protein [Streptomyces zagrosensis]|uniref:2-polyprenyl-6-methoxyphenol hydroxylase-like FAD-dependent oxidoreductase n=1 Tax=Streptomyces zagrosensis TaxID=1042984 RepID=A0A7W9QEY1_9ACTN|nr:styrene monooxygenase/indole monooxygenase family protein [Streptomyces zagrosensis]MBB5938719.1 2-polyprenyl-6-methoxyphenol hydroxylase-like FAD-dependent oxidoreductase [Streptomyces zagrosensis]
MTSVGIIGSGISGLQLALRLQQLGVPATVYSEHDIDALKAGRPRNFPARFGHTQQRERELGVFDWPSPDAQVWQWAVTVHTDDPAPLEFLADLQPPSSVVDFRIYLPHLLAAFVDRGGELVIGDPPIQELGSRHDLLVVAKGTRSMRWLFPVDASRSPYTAPQRVLCSGLYFGIGEEAPHSVDLSFLPGAGEIWRMPFYTPAGRADVISFEAIPGGPLEAISHVDIASDPAAFHRNVLDLLAVHTPALRSRIDTTAFSLIAPGEVVQGAITPVVRQSWGRLDDGTCALAIGDAWITNDPLTAQGANLGSHTAFQLAALIADAAQGPLDEVFCRDASAQLWEHARHVVEWSNAFLAEPPPHVIALFQRAAVDKRVADAFISNFNDPVAMWRTLSTPDGVAAFVDNCAGAATSSAGLGGG